MTIRNQPSELHSNRPQPRSRISILLAIVLLGALGQPLILNLSTSAPLRASSNPAWPPRAQARHLARADDLFRRAADGHNLQLMVSASSPLAINSADLLTRLYFRAVYAVFPQRVFVGRDDRVINGWAGLSTIIGAKPSVAWMRAQRVKDILTLHVESDGELNFTVTPVH